jgi:hypothetical protein
LRSSKVECRREVMNSIAMVDEEVGVAWVVFGRCAYYEGNWLKNSS